MNVEKINIDGTTLFETRYFMNDQEFDKFMEDTADENDTVVNPKTQRIKLNKKINKVNKRDMNNIIKKENFGFNNKNKKMESEDPVKGDLQAKRDPYVEYARRQALKARAASQNMKILKKLPQLSARRGLVHGSPTG